MYPWGRLDQAPRSGPGLQMGLEASLHRLEDVPDARSPRIPRGSPRPYRDWRHAGERKFTNAQGTKTLQTHVSTEFARMDFTEFQSEMVRQIQSTPRRHPHPKRKLTRVETYKIPQAEMERQHTYSPSTWDILYHLVPVLTPKKNQAMKRIISAFNRLPSGKLT